MLKFNVRQDRHVTVISNLAEMQEQGELCDFSIIIAGKGFSAHKCVLAASCEYFRAAFRFGCSSHAGALPTEPSSSLDLTHLGCQPDMVECVVRSFYTNEIDLCPSVVQDLLLLADYLMYPELRVCVETFMLQTLDHHTAIVYFQLAKHYGLDTTHLEAKVSNLLQAHFHDYFIHQPDAVKISFDTLQHYMCCGFFKFCSPLQICKFFLSSLEMTLKGPEQLDVTESQCSDVSRANQILSQLVQVFALFPSCHITRWQNSVLKYIKEWQMKSLSHKDISESLQQSLEQFAFTTTAATTTSTQTSQMSSQFCSISHHCDICSNNQSEMCDQRLDHWNGASPAADHSTPQDSSSEAHQCSTNLTLSPKDASILKSSEKAPNCDQQKPNHCAKVPKRFPPQVVSSSKILVLLAPSTEMASQLMATDEGDYRPLVKFPQLQLSLYDIQMMIWRSVGTFDFPISGAMLDKHVWRIAFLNNCLYFFSLFKVKALELNILEKQWTTLDCKDPFLPHGEQAPVKSLIPVVVAEKLILLSMSKQSKPDGTFSTQQRFYEMQPEGKTFSLVATVDDDDMELPITQWTVSGDMLITIKASSMMYRQLSRLQYIHCYNASSSKLTTHKVSCTMESGIKLLVREHSMFLLDKSGWYRSYNLDSGDWTGLTRYPQYSQPRGVVSVLDAADVIYPALTRVTCHAGASRWQVNTMLHPSKSHLEEMAVGGDGELTTVDRTPPPHQFVTAMCSGSMETEKLWNFQQASFEYL